MAVRWLALGSAGVPSVVGHHRLDDAPPHARRAQFLLTCERVFDDGTVVAISRVPLDPALTERVRPVTLARDRTMPVLPALERLVPDGLQRGIAVSVGAGRGGGATTLALALAAGASGAGCWVAAVGLPGLGLVAAAELGVALERMVVVRCAPKQAGSVVAMLGAGYPLVMVGAGMLGRRDGHRLAARLREHGTVLVAVGDELADATTLRLRVESRWVHDDDADESGRVPRLCRRRLAVTATGRGAYGIERHDEIAVEAPLFGSGGVRFESLGPDPNSRAHPGGRVALSSG